MSVDYETKADGLEAVFDAVETVSTDQIAEIKAEVTRLGASFDKLRASGLPRPGLGGGESGATEVKAFVDSYLRKGIESGVELKSLNAATGADGGYAVPEAIDAEIGRLLTDVSPIRRVANVVSVGSSDYRKLIATGGFASGWVSEMAARPETATPDFEEVAPPMGELYANPAASQAMLDDAMFNVEGWLAGEIAQEFGRAEGQAFVTGSGVNRPKGFLAYGTNNQADAVRAFGTLQHVATGTAGQFPVSNPGDKLIDLIHALRPAYRQGASFVMNSKTLSQVRKFKDTAGQYLWQPGLIAGAPLSLLGYPVVEAEDMPDVAADALSIAFGNFKAGYVIAERTATRILRDPFSNKPFVHFYATKRVGGAVVNSQAIKLLKFAAA